MEDSSIGQFSIEIKWTKPPLFEERERIVKKAAEATAQVAFDRLAIHTLTVNIDSARLEFSIIDLDEDVQI